MVRVFRCFGLFALTGTWVACVADTLTISPSGAVQGLQWVNGQQTASWTFTPNAGGATINHTDWYVDGVGVQTYWPPNTLHPYTLTVHSPGIHRVKVVMWRNQGNHPETVKSVAAIGGPLTLDVHQGQGGSLVPPRDDSAAGSPMYLQCLRTANEQMHLGQWDENEQTGTVVASLAQPPGVTLTYTLPDFLVSPDSTDGIDPLTTVTVIPDTRGNAVVTARFYMNYTDPQTGQSLVGDALDDTSSVPETPCNFHAHELGPNTVSLVSKTPYFTGQPDGAGTWGGYNFLYKLKDSEGDDMPGVWVNETFSYVPPNTTINGTSDQWINQPPGGVWQRYDYIRYVWSAATYPHWGSYPNIVHQYHGGTRAVDGTGRVVGQFTLNVIPGDMDNSPTPATVDQN